MAVPTKGSNVTVHIPVATVKDINPNNDFILVDLITQPGQSQAQYWIPLNDPRIQVTQALPANWPPVEGDVWSITIAPELIAFVVADGHGGAYFVLPQNIRDAYSGNVTLPANTDQALAQFGNALFLLYRRPPA